MNQLYFTQDWFYPCKKTWPGIFKNWSDFLKKENIDILEVGSFEGRSTIYLLEYFTQSKITCIDVFNQEKTFDDNLKSLGLFDRITKLKGYSNDKLRALNKKFDLIYIDAGHTFQEAMTDLCLCNSLLNINGLLIFDDYTHPKYNCGKAMDIFIEYFDGYKVIHKDRQVALIKISESKKSV